MFQASGAWNGVSRAPEWNPPGGVTPAMRLDAAGACRRAACVRRRRGSGRLVGFFGLVAAQK